MLKGEIKYRLDEYMIIERDGISLTWACHIAVGGQLSGNCVISGNILVLGPKKHQDPGFLKLEFYEQLRKLPTWNKTTCYGLASSLRKVDSGQSLVHELETDPFSLKIDMAPTGIKGPETFSLGWYKIIIDPNGSISWQSMVALNRTISGKCEIESGILFLGQKEMESDKGKNRREFVACLKSLPQWDKTVAWGHYGSLKVCEQSKLRVYHGGIRKPDDVKVGLGKNRVFIRNANSQKERSQSLKCRGTSGQKHSGIVLLSGMDGVV